jgi:hypothetical protein
MTLLLIAVSLWLLRVLHTLFKTLEFIADF